MTALKVMLAALFTVAGCYGTGAAALRWSRAKLDRLERVPLTFLSGAALMHLAIFALMAAHIAYRAAFAVLLVAGIAAGWLARTRQLAATPNRARAGWGLKVLFVPIFAAYTVLYLANAWAPDTSADGAGYHLGNIAQYLRSH